MAATGAHFRTSRSLLHARHPDRRAPVIEPVEAMNKFEPSPNPHITHDTPGDARPKNPGHGETAHRKKRSRSPQFGSDRRNPRDMDAQNPKISRTLGAPNVLPPNSCSGSQPVEPRKADHDRRQSWAQSKGGES